MMLPASSHNEREIVKDLPLIEGCYCLFRKKPKEPLENPYRIGSLAIMMPVSRADASMLYACVLRDNSPNALAAKVENNEHSLPERVLPRSISAILILATLAAAVIYSFWYRHHGPGYYAELNAVRADLELIPGIEVLEVTWYDEDDFPLLPQLEHITARINVIGHGKLTLQNLSESSFVDTPHLLISSIGDDTFRHRGEGFVGVYKATTGKPIRSQFAGGSIDVGSVGTFAHLFPFTISNVQTVVDRYDEIAAVIHTWPQTPSAPRSFITAEGTEILYWVVPDGANKTDMTWKSDTNWHMPYSKLLAHADKLARPDMTEE